MSDKVKNRIPEVKKKKKSVKKIYKNSSFIFQRFLLRAKILV